MISPVKVFEQAETSNVEPFSKSMECEIDQKSLENKKLEEKLSQAKLTIEQLENMIKTTAAHVNQLAAECQKSTNECAEIFEKKRCQIEYESKEIVALKIELENLKKVLEIRNEELEKAHSRNANLKNAIIANRYKIFHTHFNGTYQEPSQQSDLSSTSLETTSEDNDNSMESTTVESSELSDDTK